MMKKFSFWVIIIVLAIVLFIVFRLVIRPEIPSSNEVRDQLLIETPVGTHEDEVRTFIAEHEHWEIRGERMGDISNIDARFRNSERAAGDMSNDSVTRNITVRMDLLRSSILSTNISYAIWRFDEEGRLVDIITRVSDYQLYGWF